MTRNGRVDIEQKEKGRKCDVGFGETSSDEDEKRRRRERSTTSTVATRKFDFQIGVARIRRRGCRVLRKIVVWHVGVRALEAGNV